MPRKDTCDGGLGGRGCSGGSERGMLGETATVRSDMPGSYGLRLGARWCGACAQAGGTITANTWLAFDSARPGMGQCTMAVPQQLCVGCGPVRAPDGRSCVRTAWDTGRLRSSAPAHQATNRRVRWQPAWKQLPHEGGFRSTLPRSCLPVRNSTLGKRAAVRRLRPTGWVSLIRWQKTRLSQLNPPSV